MTLYKTRLFVVASYEILLSEQLHRFGNILSSRSDEDTTSFHDDGDIRLQKTETAAGK